MVWEIFFVKYTLACLDCTNHDVISIHISDGKKIFSTENDLKSINNSFTGSHRRVEMKIVRNAVQVVFHKNFYALYDAYASNRKHTVFSNIS